MRSAGPPASVIAALGVAQILAWGSTFYLIAVLARPIAEQTGWTLAWIVGGMSLGSLVSGLISPRVGRLIDARGGRGVLAASAVLLAAGLTILGAAPDLAAYLAGWVVIGLGMGAGLYDPAFATLGRLYGAGARGAITQLTLFGGFASTVCWPLSAWLVAQVGWRGTCLVYAAIHLAVVLPLYLLGVPRLRTQAEPEPALSPVSKPSAPAGGAAERPRAGAFWLLAAALTLAAVIMTVISVHLLTLMQARGLAMEAAVGLGALLGPAQVGARVAEVALGRRVHPVWTLIASSVLVAMGLLLLWLRPDLAALAIVLYGVGSGIRTIARGTVPLALFGPRGYATVMGRLALPTLIGQAVAPALGGWLIETMGPGVTMTVLLGAAIGAVVPSVLLLGAARRVSVPAAPV